MALTARSDDNSFVAIGLEHSRVYLGPEARDEMIAEARAAAWDDDDDDELQRPSVVAAAAAAGKKLMYGVPASVGAALNDDETLEELFAVCSENWRKYPNRSLRAAATTAEARALRLQATRGDCDEPPPPPPRGAVWNAWFQLGGLGTREAKRRYVRLMKRIDEDLVTPKRPEPLGFPKTTGGRKICPRCNSAWGCVEAPVVVGDAVLATLLRDDISGLLLRNDEKLRDLLEGAVREPRCTRGVHEAVGAATAREFERWFSKVGGFSAYREDPRPRVQQTLHDAILREHRALSLLATKFSSRDEGTRLAALDAQAVVCEGLRAFWRRWTGEEKIWENVVFQQPAARPLEDYEAVAALRRAGGGNEATGPITNEQKMIPLHNNLTRVDFGVSQRATILALGIGRSHARELARREARTSLATRGRLRASRSLLLSNAVRRKIREDLVAAVDARDLATATALVKRGAPAQLETRGGVTALMAAVLTTDRDAASALSEARADVDYVSRRTGLSALALASKRDDAVMVHHLLDLGASVVPPAAMAATLAGRLVALGVLLERAGAVNQPCEGRTLFQAAAARRDARTCIELLRRGARLDDDAPSFFFSRGPYAKFFGRIEAAEKRAVLVHAKLDRAISRLATASSNDRATGGLGRAEVDAAGAEVLNLVEEGCPDHETLEGATPLIAAATASRAAVVRELVSRGCDPNYRNKNLRTALMAAAMGGNVEASETLVSLGADASIRDLDGRAAAAFAREASGNIVPTLDDEDGSWRWRLPGSRDGAFPKLIAPPPAVATLGDAAGTRRTRRRTRRRRLLVPPKKENEPAASRDESAAAAIEPSLFRDQPGSYVKSLKTSYCDRFGARALDRLLHPEDGPRLA
ncbi:hypothetical protein CTAYLR_008428 [Chrysophaeum taylorii]|uniref:ACB domain-containing protein n=1 Tax=Chrysophaeum taylorii TaxID=2483200 RepID=A0AAD7UK92_9STRA|nr:hypothetical protein CTAYLR_008428 [Chrysophaeum taylorii]